MKTTVQAISRNYYLETRTVIAELVAKESITCCVFAITVKQKEVVLFKLMGSNSGTEFLCTCTKRTPLVILSLLLKKYFLA